MFTTMAPFLYQTKTLCNMTRFKPMLAYRSHSTGIMRGSFQAPIQRFVTRGYRTRSSNTSFGAGERDPSRRQSPESWGAPSETRRDWNTATQTQIQDDDIPMEGGPPMSRRDWNTTRPRETQRNDMSMGGGRPSRPRGGRNSAKTAPDEDIHFEGELPSMPKKSKRGGAAFDLMDSVRVNEFGEADDRPPPHRRGTFRYSVGLEESEEDGDFDSIHAHRPRESTITDTEKAAFQRIFEEMFAQNQGDAPSPIPQMTASAPSPGRGKSKMDAILKTALEHNAKTRMEKETVVNRYPPVLRSSIAKAIRLTEDDTESEVLFGTTAKEPELDQDQLETLREPERIRVETLMNEAKTDFELFDIMEKEVFSLIPRLGLEEGAPGALPPTTSEPLTTSESTTPEIPTTTKVKRKSKKKEAAEKREAAKELIAKSENTITDSTTGTEVSALNLYGPLYPSYLLLGLRLLDRAFAKPSPLTLSILPKVRSLGSISHVLGGTTQLYNEVLRIYFHRYEDFGAVIKTLEEMEVSAVGLDEETLEIVNNIIKMHNKVTHGERGPVMQALWSMNEFSTHAFPRWRHKIATALAKKNGTEDLESIELESGEERPSVARYVPTGRPEN